MRKLLGGLATLTAPVVAMAMLTGCQSRGPSEEVQPQQAALEKAQLDDLLEQCGFECTSLAEGNASISGAPSIDAFFSAVLKLESEAALLRADVNAALGEMAAVLGAEAGGNVEATAENVVAKFESEIQANLDGGLTLDYREPKCQVDANATVEAAAKCDATVNPGSAKVECKGECVAEASAMAECEGELKCTGTAPAFDCQGTCQGSCELDVGAKCEGTCTGKCEVNGDVDCDGECIMDGSAECDGTCHGELDDEGNCTGECELDANASCTGECKVRAGGTCEGTCRGSCELSAGAECEGKCKGECTWDAPMAECSGKASCTAEASASVECQGECKGEVEPPEVSAECEATAKAEAEFSAECTPPSVDVSYDLKGSFAANADADARAEFGAKVEAFVDAYAKLLASGAKLEGVVRAQGEMLASLDTVADTAVDMIGDADVKAAFKLGCVAGEIGPATDKITNAGESLAASGEAIAKVSAGIAGS